MLMFLSLCLCHVKTGLSFFFFSFWEFVFKMDFSLSGSASNMHDIYGYFIVSMATAQRWPFRVLRLCMRWANFRETVAGEQPGSNVCRCIPNWGIAFLVIAISICALLSLLSHFKLSLIPLFPSSSLAHRRVLRHTPSLALSLSLSPSALSLLPPDFSLSLTHIDSALEHVGVQHIL